MVTAHWRGITFHASSQLRLGVHSKSVAFQLWDLGKPPWSLHPQKRANRVADQIVVDPY